ncbi:hypothetical protein JOD31_000895 [Methylopila capsulata]|uniref:Lipoprotein n=1 Tax=Methylopila capsulata TaxID=61654 RepID=A0A9W6MS66_9HYPH|nr:hypothetical protein [Methylopila capsulata]MBM7850683.1 hypothetical protein [Methylopila capsulata]GLK55978.1 hypothetical protein GCM10008170_19970 [Methylopila capsulata]
MTRENLRRAVRLGVAAGGLAALGLSGCATRPERTPENSGMATCRAEDMVYCKELAGYTHRSLGPAQIEYIAPDGKLYLWVNDRITKGYWEIGHGLGTFMCYNYGGPSNCKLLSVERRKKDESVPGDPLRLAERPTAPLALEFFDSRTIVQLVAEVDGAKPTAAGR